MKKTGLADSPFFNRPAPAGPTVILDAASRPEQHEPVEPFSPTVEQMNERSNVQPAERSSERTPERSAEQLNNRSIARKSYDVFVDQDDLLEALRLAMRQTKKRNVTKGHVIRQALEIGLAKLKKKYLR